MYAKFNRRNRVMQIAAALFPLVAFAGSAHADIFQWEYINPADPSQGKQQSTTLAPDGAGVDAVPGSNLSGRNLALAYLPNAPLREANLSGTNLHLAHLTGTDFRQANLANANFESTSLTNANLSGADARQASFGAATLTDADFTGAEIRGASFAIDFANAGGTGITLAQLYSTASYEALDLTGINLWGNDLSGWNFAGQNLTNANFYSATLTNANFAGAEIRGASFSMSAAQGTGITLAQLYSTASYQAHDLSGVALSGHDLSDGNFAGQNFTNADFAGAVLTDADFSGALVRGADFSFTTYTGFTLAQLYSTASYQAHDLSGIDFTYNNLAGGNFAGQNLNNADFGAANLISANFREANLANARFAYCPFGRCRYATLADADLTAADARGATALDVSDFSEATTANLIRPHGQIDGLNLDSGGLLIVRDYDGNPNNSPTGPIPITIDQHLAMGPDGTLRLVFEADVWDSTISFAPGIPVTLNGTLELTFAADVNLASQVGRSFDLFDWTGVDPTGAFTIASPYAWNLSNLYTTGEVTLITVPEPASIGLAAVAFSLILYCRRKIT
jgi:uncharacterized protein YjbI with pentapeptide repeats